MSEAPASWPAEQEAARALKARHRALWASGDYPAVAADLIPALGPRLVQACGIRAGQRVLDVAAGTGNAAIPAAEAGARVTAGDLTPELFTAGRDLAARRGVAVDWVEADAEAMPFADNEFDVVMSCVGAMFAPRHGVTAGEIIRVTRPGGTIGMINWTPDGFIGRLFATMKPYAPPAPPGASPPPLWGDEDHVRELFAEAVTDLTMRRETVVMAHSADPRAFREYWKANYCPTIATYRYTEADPDRLAALDSDFLALLESANTSATPGRTAYPAEYLLVTATKR